MKSLQKRLGSGLLLSLIISFSVLWIVVSYSIKNVADEYIASRLKHDADTLLNAIDFNPQTGMLTVDNSRIDQVYQQPFSGHYFVINTSNMQIQSRSLWDQQLELTLNESTSPLRSLQTGPDNQLLLLVTSHYIKQGVPLFISIAEDLNPIKHNIKEFQYEFALILLLMLLLLVLLQTLFLRYSLKPVNTIHTELKLLQQGQLDKLDTNVPEELQPLVNEVNHLLSIMQQRLHRSRDSLADLTHAIKKPLTIIQQQLDNSDISRSTKDILLSQTDDIHRLTERILKRGQLAGHRYSGALFSFSEDLPALIKTLDMMYAGKAPHLNLHIPLDIHCPLDRQDMLELLGNLLDNAYKWARSSVTLRVESNHQLHIEIEDDGPGTDQNKINDLSKRGVRLDETIAGHGFGLAIVADIVKQYGGTIHFTQATQASGLNVSVIIPLNNNLS